MFLHPLIRHWLVLFHWAFIILSAQALTAADSHSHGAEPEPSRPNFLIFMADDMTYHDLASVGNPDVRTPHLDRFATQGTTFTHAYNSSPMCAPTRMSLYTGLHPVRHGGYPNHSQVHPEVRTLPHLLGDLGYDVALLGKRHEEPAAQFPFNVLGGKHGDKGEGLDLDTNKVGDYLATHADEPWCLVVTSNQPHTPWTRGDASVYDPTQLELPPYLADTPTTRKSLAAYYAEITYLDAQFGRVMAQLEAHGDAENTLVIFLTEQGSNFPFCKWTCYETGLRATAIMRWPNQIPSDVKRSTLIQYIDITPTLIDLAGGQFAPKQFDGVSLAQVITEPDSPAPHQYVFGLQTTRGIYHGSEAYGIRSIRDDHYRLVWNLNYQGTFQNTVTRNFPTYQSWKPSAQGGDLFAAQRLLAYTTRPEFELYDLANDPWSMTNLAADPEHAGRIHELHAAIQKWMKQQGDQGIPTELAAKSRIPQNHSRN